MPVFKLPDLGEGVGEAEIDRWLVQEGQEIAEDDPLVEVITDKATAEIPSPFAGVVNRIHHAAGEVVPVGTTLVTIGEDVSPRDRTVAPPPPTAATVSRRPSSPQPSETSSNGGDSVKAMPPVRKLARDLNVDLMQVTGTGPGGRILRTDVEAHSTPAARIESGPTAAERREPLRGVRRTIAHRMSEAHRLVPPVTHVEECDVTELDATRKLANERNPDGVKLTFLPFIVKAVVTALQDHPAMNASLDEDAQEIVFHDRYDIGIAVDTDAGLTVPVVRGADRKRLVEIASDIERFATAAREGSLKSQDLSGGTFTVTSPGPFGGLMATPIVFHPQSGILGVHRAVDRPVVRDGQIVIRKMMNLSVTFDHRVLDGMTAAKFVLDVVTLLEHPAVLALEN